MGYQDITVARVREQTEKIKTATDKYFSDAPETAEKAKAYPQVNGVMIRPELKEFIDKIRQTYKFYEVGFTRHCQTTWVSGLCDVFEEAVFYVPNEMFARGAIGYGTGFGASGRKSEDKAEYMVYSRLISNSRYRSDRKQKNMVRTDNLDKALRSAYKYLQPYSLNEVAEVSRSELAWNMRRLAEGKKYESSGTYNAITDRKLLVNELQALVQSGYKFVSEEFASNVGTYFQQMKEYQEKYTKPVNAYFVLFRNDHNDEPIVEVTECFNVREGDEGGRRTYGEKVVLKQEDLPIDIAGKVAVINMTEQDRYVEGVGMKVNDTSFWIERV